MKTIADDSQLYRAAGFTEVEPLESELERIANAVGGRDAREELRASTWLRSR
jgi:hypothetical protein